MLATWLWRDAVEFARFTAHKGPFSRRFCLEWWRKTHLTFYVMSILKVTHRHLGVKCVLLLIRQRKLRNDWDLLFVCTFSTKGHRYAKEFKVLYSSGMALDFDSVWCLQDVLKCLFYGYEMTWWWFRNKSGNEICLLAQYLLNNNIAKARELGKVYVKVGQIFGLMRFAWINIDQQLSNFARRVQKSVM